MPDLAAADVLVLATLAAFTVLAVGFVSTGLLTLSQAIGIIMGSQWAYVELGWGGYWGWDPVENSSLIPWLAATAFLHSALVQRRTGRLVAWNVLLAIGVHGLCLLGVFVTRSGIIASVHAFARSSVGPFLAVILALTVTVSAALLAWRGPLPHLSSGRGV